MAMYLDLRPLPTFLEFEFFYYTLDVTLYPVNLRAKCCGELIRKKSYLEKSV